MQQLTLSRPLATTRVLTLPDKPRTPRKAPAGTKAPSGTAAEAAAAAPGWSRVGTSPRKRLTLNLRPVQSLSPRPSLTQPLPRGRELPCGAVTFTSAAQAWFWTLRALAARRGDSRQGKASQRSAHQPSLGEAGLGERSLDQTTLGQDNLGQTTEGQTTEGQTSESRRSASLGSTGLGSTGLGSTGDINLRRAIENHSYVRIPRPCDPDDIIRALDLLHRQGAITLAHARVLRRWGDRRHAPDATLPDQKADAMLWSEALARLEVLLRAKTIVAVI